MTPRRPKIVVLGMMSKMPAAGVVWQNINYLVGFEQLGYEVWYVEAHARTPTTLMLDPHDDSSMLAASFIERALRRVGMDRRWAFHALHDDGRVFGLDRAALEQLYREAALIVNLHGGTIPLEEHSATGRLIYLETDPVEIQVQLHKHTEETIAFLQPHVAFFTFGENYGRPGCRLPVDDQFAFRPTRQPVVLDFWAGPAPPPDAPFTTIGNFRQPYRDVWLHGERYSWSKHHEFEKVLGLPGRVSVPLELALASHDEADEARLRRHGWGVRTALEVSEDPDIYRRYIQRSAGEFTVAKDQNVRLRTGWFSDRSATYLAAGVPVVTQDTGFGDVLPTGEGLLSFTTLDEAADAVEAIASDPARHRRLALEIARDCFSADRVLGRLLDDLGMPVARRRTGPSRVLPFPSAMRLAPRTRRPLVLEPATEFALAITGVGSWDVSVEPLDMSVVVVAYNQLQLTRLCLETLLAGWDGGGLEVIVVDNASSDDTGAYLRRLAAQNANVRVIANGENLGFVRGCNQGLAAASAERIVILNNDTIPPPGALSRLARHLDDPSIGLVGPVTNHAPNEARIPVAYATYGEMVQLAETRGREHRGARDYAVATLFCGATRRDVLEKVGYLDELFGFGLFDDDDLSLRVLEAGYRVVCAEDVFVHHVGEASFGDLVPDGTYSKMFEANRARFEAKWGRRWQPHCRRPDDDYLELVDRVLTAVQERIPLGGRVAVVSRGDDAITALDGYASCHIPMGEDGGWSGFHPTDTAAAVGAIQAAVDARMTHLVFPATERWWLEHYDGLREHLDQTARMILDEPDTGVLYALGEEP